jgi:hypothetical protein
VANTTKTPVHLWIVGALAVLWNFVGAYDYLMTQTENEAYMAKFEPAQLEYFYNFPTWVVAAWAIAVWFGVLGSVLLLVRRRLAEPVLLVSLVAMTVTAVYNYGLSDGIEMMGSAGFAFTLVIFIVAVGLWLYARAMRGRGLLA